MKRSTSSTEKYSTVTKTCTEVKGKLFALTPNHYEVLTLLQCVSIVTSNPKLKVMHSKCMERRLHQRSIVDIDRLLQAGKFIQ